jgi:hypothetical protein
MLNLPRPCRYEDLTAATWLGELPSISLVVDVPREAACEALMHWREVLPVTCIRVLAFSFNQEQVNSFIKADRNATLSAVIAGNFVEEDAVKACDSLAWATCAPYDSSGVYVKTDIEMTLAAVLRRSRGIFLAHDPKYKVIRQFDSEGLRDRVFNRAWRRRVYRIVWQITSAVAWVAARLSIKLHK